MSSSKLPKARKKKAPPKERSPPELAQEPPTPASLTPQAGQDENEDPVTAYNREVNQAIKEKIKKMVAFHKAVHSFHSRPSLPSLQKQGELLVQLYEMALPFRPSECEGRKLLANFRKRFEKRLIQARTKPDALLRIVEAMLCEAPGFPCEQKDQQVCERRSTRRPMRMELVCCFVHVLLETLVLGGRRLREEELYEWAFLEVPDLDVFHTPAESIELSDLAEDAKDESEDETSAAPELGERKSQSSGANSSASQRSPDLFKAESGEDAPDVKGDQKDASPLPVEVPEPTAEEDAPQSAKLESQIVAAAPTTPSPPASPDTAAPTARALPVVARDQPWPVEEAWERDGVYGPALGRLAALTAKLKERRLARQQ